MHELKCRMQSERTRSRWVICILLVAATLAVYVRVHRCDFVPALDDVIYVTGNEPVRQGLSFDGLRWAFRTNTSANWIPLTWLSLMLDATVYRDWAGGYHLTNVLLHASNVLLLFAFLTRGTGCHSRSAAVAALFAVHPLHVESVAWVTERKDVLSMFFGLLALNAYVRYTYRPRLGLLAAALFAYLCSLLAKQTLVTLPFLLLLLDFWPLRRLAHCSSFAASITPRRGGFEIGLSATADAFPSASRKAAGLTRMLIEKLPFLVIAVAASVIVLHAQTTGGALRTLTERPLMERLLNAVMAYALYLRRAVFPFDLCAFYPHPGEQLSPASVVPALAILLAVTLSAIALCRRRPFVLVGWLWFLGGLLPMIGLVQVGLQQMADRYTYFPLIGVYVATAWGVPSLVTGPRLRRWLPVAAASTVAAYGVLAFVQVGYWHDAVTLMRRAISVTENNAFGHCLLADALMDNGRFDEAIAEYREAVRASESRTIAYYRTRLGVAYERNRRFDEAANEFRAAIARHEDDAAAHNNLGRVLLAMNEYLSAEREFRRALEIEPNNPFSYYYLGYLHWAIRDYETSKAYCMVVLRGDGGFLMARHLLAANLRDQGRLDEAIDLLSSTSCDFPYDVETRAQLAALLESQRIGGGIRRLVLRGN